MTRARDIPDLTPDLMFREAASAVVSTRADEVWEFEERALDKSDIEGVHDMRVATRRLRAVLEIFEPAFPKKRHKQALSEVKRLADTLGERRDPDVMIERLEQVARELSHEEHPGVKSLIDELREGQEKANRKLEKRLARAREERLPERLELLAKEVRR